MVHGAAKVALVTARPRPEVGTDLDMPLLHQAFAGENVEAEVVPWDDPSVDWAAFDLAVVRSPWDYSWREEEFHAWVDHCATQTRLANPPDIIHWNARKDYLRDLQAKSVPIVPTRFIAPGEAIDLPREQEFVVKPAVGAGARLAARYGPADGEKALVHARSIHAGGVTVMIQPYLHRIDVTGERALVFVQGELLHAIRKTAILTPGLGFDQPREGHPGTGPWTPTPAELDLAHRALAAVPDAPDLLYARVDMADDEAGDPVLTELELVEPHLYLRFQPGSIPKFVAAIVRAAEKARLDP